MTVKWMLFVWYGNVEFLTNFNDFQYIGINTNNNNNNNNVSNKNTIIHSRPSNAHKKLLFFYFS